MLIYHGTTPLPGTDRWNKLSEQVQKQIYADYAEINHMAGVTSGLPRLQRI
jgi:hypothetical protein